MKRTKTKVASMGIPVCWKCSSSGKIHWSIAVTVEYRGNNRRIIRFDDGGWNPAEDCFFTEDQCQKYHKMPPPQFVDYHNAIATRLENLAKSIRKQYQSPQ